MSIERWKVSEDLFGWPHVYDQDGCRLSNDRPPFSADEWKAKCHIMAAALDLRDTLEVILPMAKGFAAEHPVGRNAEMVVEAEATLRAAKGEPS